MSERFSVWYSAPIGKIRVDAAPGGDAFTIEEAEAFREELDAVIDEAKANGDDAE